MSETGPTPEENDEAEWQSPETDGSEWRDPEPQPQPEADTSAHQSNEAAPGQPVQLPTATGEERDVVLRNAQAYLYEREKLSIKDKESPFHESRTQKIGKLLDTYLTKSTKDFPWWQDKLKSKFPQSDLDRLGRSAIDFALVTATDDEKFDVFMEAERSKGPGKENLTAMRNVIVFREAVSLRDKATRLIDERRRGVTPERSDEIDAELNNAYAKIIQLAHSKSYEINLQYDEKVKREKVDRSIPRLRGETDSEWRNRVQKTRVERKLKDGQIDYGAVTGQESRVSQDVYNWHNNWTKKVQEGENLSGYAQGTTKPIETKGELNHETIDSLREVKHELSSVITDVLAQIDPKELQERYGVRVTIQKPESVKRYRYGTKKDSPSCSATPTQEITLHLQDGSFAHFELKSRGFLEEKDGKLSVTNEPPHDRMQFYDKEFVGYRQTVLKPKGNERFPFPTLSVIDPDRRTLEANPAYRELINTLSRIETDHPDARQEAARRRQEAAAQPPPEPEEEEEVVDED